MYTIASFKSWRLTITFGALFVSGMVSCADGDIGTPDTGSADSGTVEVSDAGSSHHDTDDAGQHGNNGGDAGGPAVDDEDSGTILQPDAGAPVVDDEDSGTILQSDGGAPAVDDEDSGTILQPDGGAPVVDDEDSGTMGPPDEDAGASAEDGGAMPTEDGGNGGGPEPEDDGGVDVDVSEQDGGLPHIVDGGESPSMDAGSCGEIGQACTEGSNQCQGPHQTCLVGVCVPSYNSICGGVVGEMCVEPDTSCGYCTGCDFGPCLSGKQWDCVCNTALGRTAFPRCSEEMTSDGGTMPVHDSGQSGPTDDLCGPLGDQCNSEAQCGDGYGCQLGFCVRTGAAICGGIVGQLCAPNETCMMPMFVTAGMCLNDVDKTCLCNNPIAASQFSECQQAN